MSLEVEHTSRVTCPSCGQENPAGWLVCASCHAPLRPTDPVTEFEPSEAKDRRHHRKTSRLALASLAFGILGIFAPAGLVAIILGHLAQIQLRRHRDEYRGRDVAKLGLVLGYLGVAVFAVLFFGLRNMNVFTPKHAEVASNAPKPGSEKYDPFYRAIKNRPAVSAAELENKGVLLVKALQQAETIYKNANPKIGYTCVLEDLFQSGFDDSMVKLSIDTGYTVSITDCGANPTGVHEAYRAFATPPSGNGKLICSDEKGVIRSSDEISNDLCLQNGKPVAVQ